MTPSGPAPAGPPTPPRGERLLAVAVRLLPPGRRDLGRALLAESAAVPAARRTRWLAGGLWFVARESVRRPAGYLIALAVALTALLTVDHLGTSDDSGQVTLLLLLATAALLGFTAPRWAWLAGLALGSAIAAESALRVLTTTAPTHPAGPGGPAGLAGAATLLVLVAPAMLAAYLGAAAGWWRHRSTNS
jgi:hypothetical protein